MTHIQADTYVQNKHGDMSSQHALSHTHTHTGKWVTVKSRQNDTVPSCSEDFYSDSAMKEEIPPT